jgi:hypothetical protein
MSDTWIVKRWPVDDSCYSSRGIVAFNGCNLNYIIRVFGGLAGRAVTRFCKVLAKDWEDWL